MITTVTGKNQITIPAKIADQQGIKPGSLLDWQISSREHVLEVYVYPDPATMAKGLKGRGRKASKKKADVVERLVEERRRELKSIMHATAFLIC